MEEMKQTSVQAPFYSVRGVYKSFGDTQVLKGVDVDMERGQVLAIIGSSGSGKTTLLRCMSYLEMPDSARIELDGQVVLELDPIETQSEQNAEELTPAQAKKQARIQAKQVARARKEQLKQFRTQADAGRKHFGMVFQSFHLFPHMSVLRNVALAVQLQNKKKFPKWWDKSDRAARKQADRAAEQTAIAWLERVGLGDKLKSYPCELSGGQQQRVAIARALMLQPDILCFDEPTSALDPELTREVLRVIRDLKRDGHTMIVVTHEMEFARRVADKVIFMADGVVEEVGAPEQVFGNPRSEKTRAFLLESERGLDD